MMENQHLMVVDIKRLKKIKSIKHELILPRGKNVYLQIGRKRLSKRFNSRTYY